MNVVSVVCARAGSKGLKNKCVSMINNKMVVEYAIEYSLSLGNNVKTVVSTDIKKIINHCEINDIQFINRKPELCADNSRIDDALADVIIRETNEIEYCSLVYGNMPTRYPNLFYEALKFLEDNSDYDAAISMQNVEKYHPEWMDDYNETLLPQKKEAGYLRQLLPQKMIHDGHTFIFRIKKFISKYNGLMDYNREYSRSIYGEKIKPMINDEFIIDIDTRRDVVLANSFIKDHSRKHN